MSAKSNAGRIGVWGASGSGKSAYVKKRIRKTKRLVVFDPLAEYHSEGMSVATTPDAVRRQMLENWSGFRIAYCSPSGREPRALSQLCKLIMRAQMPFKETGKGETLTLVVEEMNLSFPVAGGDQKCPAFAEICSRGRHYGIEVFGVSQRLAEVSTRWRGNCDETIVLRQKGPRDLKAAAEELGGHVNQIKALQNLDYLHEKAGSISKGRVTF